MTEFVEEFSSEPEEAILWAFKMWRRQSRFTPTICDMYALFGQWHREKHETAEAEKRRAERGAEEQARREGKLVGIADIQQQLAQALQSQPEPEHLRKHREFRLRMERAATAVSTLLHLTEDQIAARREKEREEIRRYRES